MKITRIAHVGVAVRDIDDAAEVYTKFLGLEKTAEDSVGELRTGFIPIGETDIELVMSTSEDGAMNKYISRRGEGLHHIALEVEDIFAACQELKDKGVPLLGKAPYDGAHGAKVMFLHPKATRGVLIELCQYPEGH